MERSKGAAAAAAAAAKRRKAGDGPVAAPDPDAGRPSCPSLSLDLLAKIHGHLPFLDRLAFAAVFGESCKDQFEPEAPCLLLPGSTADTARLFSFAERRAASARVPDPAMRDYLVIGSNHGWLATADDRGQIYLTNPTTGAQHELQHIATMGVFLPEKRYHKFSVVIKDFLAARYGGGPPFELHRWGPQGYGTCTYSACQMRRLFYRKVVLSDSPRAETYAAMLILDPEIGAPAFATAEDPAWRLARSPDGVEDAIFQPDGKFWSVSYTGVVESWERDADTGMYQSTPVAPTLALPAIKPCPRKYLVAAPDGRLMVVHKYSEVIEGRYSQDRQCRCSFKVHVLGDGGLWEETTDIGEAALFVGVNNSLCVSTRGRPEIMAGCVYYADDDLWKAAVYKRSRGVGVYSLNHGAMTCLELGPHDGSSSWPPPAWMTPSLS